MTMQHLGAQGAIALDRIVRCDRRNDALDARHHVREVEFHARVAQAERARVPRQMDELCRTNQCLRGHAAEIEAISAHQSGFHQGHFRLGDGADIGGDQAGRTAADDDQIAVEAMRLFPAAIYLARLDPVQRELRQQRKDAQQRKRSEQRRRCHVGKRPDLSELGAGVDVDDRPRQHPQLADPVECRHPDRSEPHRQIDQKEGKDRHQAKRQQIERPVLPHARIDGRALFFEVTPDEIAQHVARHDEGDGGANGGSEGNQYGAPQQAEQCPRCERHDGRAGQRRAGDQNVNREE